jgi:hypothetical protein
MINKEKQENNYVSFEIVDGIVIAYYKGGVKINLEVAKEVVLFRHTYFEGKDFPVLVCDAGMASVDKEARDYLSTPEAVKYMNAGALLVSSTFFATIANFFLKVNFMTKLLMPTKMFTNREEAIEWLKGYRSTDKSESPNTNKLLV